MAFTIAVAVAVMGFCRTLARSRIGLARTPLVFACGRCAMQNTNSHTLQYFAFPYTLKKLH